MSWAVEAQRAWHTQTADEIAHAWVVGIVERTALGDLSGIALGWLGRQAPALVSDLLEELNASPADARGLPPSAASCVRGLVRLREPRAAAVQFPRDLALLQVLLGEAISRNLGVGEDDEIGRRSRRLVEIFGEIQSEFAQALLDDQLESEGLDRVTGLPGEAEFREELGRLVAVASGRGAPFSVLELDLDGLRHVNEVEGREAGDALLRRVAELARGELGGGTLFRREGDELAALLPGSAGPAALTLANRLRAALQRLDEGEPGTPLSIGVACWPAHAESPAELLERVREAAYLAKASGEGVALAERRLQRT